MEPSATADGAVSQPRTAENRAGHACPECDFMAKTKSGLGVHRRARHAENYHADARRTADSRGPRNWTPEELDMLAKAEGELITSGNINKKRVNQQLEGVVAGRSHQAVVGIRKTQGYKSRVERWVEVLSQDNIEGEHPRDGRVGDDPLVEERQARETILEQVFLTRYSGSPKFGSQVLNEGLDALEGRWRGMAWPRLREELKSLIDRHAEYLISGGDSLTAQRKGRRRPRRNHTGPGVGVHVRPPPLTPQGRREFRRANYKSLQNLYAKDRSRAAKTIYLEIGKP